MTAQKHFPLFGLAFSALISFPASAQLKVHSTNKVTIGPTVSTPTEQLEVNGNIRLLDANKLLLGDENRFVGKVGSDLGLVSRQTGYWLRIGSKGGVGFWGGGSGAESTASPHMFLTEQGDLAIGSNNWTEGFKLRVWGSSKGNGTWQVSDSKFKKDITPIDSALEKVLKLKGCEYSYRKDEFPGFETYGDKVLGFIAQEVKVVIPEAVDSPKDGSMSINYDMLIPLLVEAIKVQEQRIQELQQEVVSIKALPIPRMEQLLLAIL